MGHLAWAILTYKGIATSNAAHDRCVRGLSDASRRSCRRVWAFSNHTIRIAGRRVECDRNASRSKGPGALARELHRVVQFHYVGVSIRDEKLNTFHRHFVDAETEADVPPDPELTMEESDAWWVYQNQEPLVTSLDVHDARFSKFQEILKKSMESAVCALSP